MRPGEVLEVRLPGSSATDRPQHWAIAAAPPQLRPCEWNVAPQTPGAAGADAVRVFRFAAVAEGEGRLAFDGGEPSRRISFQVHSYSDTIID